MKILHTVESYLPARHGMQEVVTQLSERLVTMGHNVTVATSYDVNRDTNVINGVAIADFKIKGNTVYGIKGEAAVYQDFLRNQHFDIIVNFAAQQWATDLMLPILDEINAKKVFVPTGFSGLGLPAYNTYFNNMKQWLKQYDANIFLAENFRDINFAKANGIKKIELIPNGANEDEFLYTPFTDIRQLIGVGSNIRLILTVGNHTGFKGHNECAKIFREADIDNSVLLIVGNSIKNGIPIINFAKEMVNIAGLKKTNCSIKCKVTALKFNAAHVNKSILIKAFDRAATINAFKQADVFLFPSLFECSPIVLFESLAGGTPFLVSDVGNSKEIIKWTKGGKLLPTKIDSFGLSQVQVKESSIILREFIADKVHRENMGKAGNAAVLSNFTWSKIAKRYEKLYLELMQ